MGLAVDFLVTSKFIAAPVSADLPSQGSLVGAGAQSTTTQTKVGLQPLSVFKILILILRV